MKYFAAVQSVLNSENTGIFREKHLEYLESMVAQGKIFAMGRFLDGSGGLTIFQAESLEEAQETAQSDPYVMNKVRKLEIHEWAMKIQS